MATKEVSAETYWLRRTRCLGICMLFALGAPASMMGVLQLSPELGVFEGWSDGAGMIAIAILIVMTALAVFFVIGCGSTIATWTGQSLN